ncbi:hypothetical protein ACFWPX_30095 [Nocardia sp. NPDC058518]|uniref:hypothetical protein n=1 Tax=Nocardia sp. NPDC058518 TaxID=3346534 RepID=UPI0036518C43
MNTYCAIPSCHALDLAIIEGVQICTYHAWVVHYWELAHAAANAPISLTKAHRIPAEDDIDPLDHMGL